MPTVHLTFQADSERAVPGTSGPVVLAEPRVRVWVQFGTEPFTRQAVLDTGAPACIVPKRIWAALDVAGEVVWEAGAPATAPLAALPTITVLGGQHRFRLGRVRLELIDLGGGRLTPRAVRAICTEDAAAVAPGGPPQVPLLVGWATHFAGARCSFKRPKTARARRRQSKKPDGWCRRGSEPCRTKRSRPLLLLQHTPA